MKIIEIIKNSLKNLLAHLYSNLAAGTNIRKEWFRTEIIKETLNQNNIRNTKMQFNSYAVKSAAQVLPAGLHEATITRVSCGKSPGKHTPYVDCLFKNEKGFIWTKVYFHENKTTGFANNFLQIAGIDINKNNSFDETVFLGKKMLIKVVEKEWFDKRTGEVRTYQEVSFCENIPQEDINKIYRIADYQETTYLAS